MFFKTEYFSSFPFPCMAENRSFSISMRKTILESPYVLIKKVSKIPKFNKRKKKKPEISVFLKTSPSLLLKKNLCQITVKNGPMVRIFKSKSEVLACTEKKRVRENFHMIIWKRKSSLSQKVHKS